MTKKQRKANVFAVESVNKQINLPSVCPYCSRKSSKRTNILIHEYQVSSAEIWFFGLFGMIFKFMLGADYLDSKKVLTVATCGHCYNIRLFYRVLEWISRLGGILLLFVFLELFPGPNKPPLIQQNFSMILLVFSPFIIGAILAYLFRYLGDHRKGIVFAYRKNEEIWFRARSNDWFREYSDKNPVQSHAQTNTSSSELHFDQTTLSFDSQLSNETMSDVDESEIQIYSNCPACGSALPTDYNSCPDCGLFLR
jgi:predicted Zn-ribbon and HTH transcriptional regulator